MNVGHDYDQELTHLSDNGDEVYENNSDHGYDTPDDHTTSFGASDKEFLGFSLPRFLWNVPEGDENAGKKINTGDLYSSRKEQVQALLDDLKNGFSLKFAFQRFQYLRSATTPSLKLSSFTKLVTDSYYNTLNAGTSAPLENKNGAMPNEIQSAQLEPGGVDPVVQPSVPPIIDEMIYPRSRQKDPTKKKKLKKRKKKPLAHKLDQEFDGLVLSESDSNYYLSGSDTNAKEVFEERMDTLRLFSSYENFVNLDPEEYKHPDLLRKRIIAVTKIPDLSDKHKGQLVQRLMLGRTIGRTKLPFENILSAFSLDGSESGGYSDDDDLNDIEEGDESDDAEDEEDERDIPKFLSADERESYYDSNNKVYGCSHYQTSCKLQCPTCQKFYTCRNCHDAVEITHAMSRKDVNMIACMACGKIQEPAEECIECENVFAEYFCEKCKLYDNDPNKNIYHCDDCGICRLGLGLGIDYYHCHGCNACISVLLENDHKCIENRTKCDCPICGDFMFTSKKKVVVMPCGHAIHQNCYDEYVKTYYKCPICSRTIINMDARFRETDNEIEMQPMPHPYNSWKCVIACNDCNTKSVCNYHILGLKCEICHSYNTAQIRLIKPEEDATVFSDDGVTNTEYEEDDEFTTDDYTRIIGVNKKNTLLASFFNENSEVDPDPTTKNNSSFFTRNTSKGDTKNTKTRRRRVDSVSRVKGRKSRSNSLKTNGILSQNDAHSFTGPMIANTFANNIRNMINSATASTSNYYNEFIQAALDSLDAHEDEEAFKDGDLINFNKINNLKIQDFFNSNNQPDGAPDKKMELEKGVIKPDSTQPAEALETENNMPSLGDVLRKWANSTAGISDSDDYDDYEEDEESDDEEDNHSGKQSIAANGSKDDTNP